ncbi:hypothetical protein KZF14_001449 [Campylobacter jejuni]|nr:hypothetical protein [Campylobacter jejuni]EFU2278877.1 hypothetical protein [Campylobacter jejuni]EGA7744421.1 hypothetical protein [Campylobacter jejuni]EGB1381855.1 hypothetical protein [Campylobacter jejuni]EGK6720412.1 hypothetical protein [Campylobacter jejuni]
MQAKLIFILLLGVLFFSACSTKNQGKYDEFLTIKQDGFPSIKTKI